MDALTFYTLVESKNEKREFWSGVQIHSFGATVHTYLETGGYDHIIGNNFAGIKCTKGWLDKTISISNGKCVNAATQEYISGKTRVIDGEFRAYDDINHFLLDYSRLIYFYYPVVKDSYDCLWGYFAGLHGKWATDPRYFYKLVDVAFSIAPQVLKGGYTGAFVKEYKIAIAKGVLTLNMQAYLEKRLP